METEYHTVKGSEILSGDLPPTGLDPRTNGKIFQIWECLKTEDPAVEVHYTHINAGHDVGAHMHPDATHYLIIIKGIAHVWIDGEVIILEEGDFLEIPRYKYHNFSADPNTDVWDLSVTHPGWELAEMQYDAEFGEKNKIQEALEKSWKLTEKRFSGAG